jgi:hypothetical protein
MDTLYEDQYKSMAVSRLVLLRMKNISNRIVKKTETHNLDARLFFLNRGVYEIGWKNMVEPDSPHMTI